MRFWMRNLTVAAMAAFSMLAAPALAQVSLPGVAYDPAIPTMESVLGKPAGGRITPSADLVRYARALERAAPTRIKVISYARSWQDRELVYIAIGSPERIAALDAIGADMRALADPRKTDKAAADAIIARTPATVWLAHGVHGDEISSSDSAMMTAYHLLAAKNDPVVDAILANDLVFLDPIQNPDGRDRFINGYYDTLGLTPASSPIAAERNQPWPGGRVNTYLFDMNRDWFALTQPETRGRVAVFQQYFPLIFVDLHEMDTDSTYYFSPEADPYNPDIMQNQRDFLRVIGRNNASWFDREGYSYFTREVYDDFYPGYGAGWPLFHGSIGTTYENATTRGLMARRADGTEFSYADSVRRHFLASIATLQTAAAQRERLLREFYAYRAATIEAGRKGEVRSYILPPQTDQASADKLAGLLVTQGVEVKRATGAIRACRKSFPEGSYAISLAQPAGRLAHTLLEPHVPLDKTFMAEQERRRAKDLDTELYDVTAWSLPLMFNLSMERCADEPAGPLAAAEPMLVRPGVVTNPGAAFGFLAPWGSASSVRLLAAALREGIAVSSPDVAFTHDGRNWPAGTLVFRKVDTPDLAARLAKLARETGAALTGIDDSWVTKGPSFGSDRVVRPQAPRIAIAWDQPTRAASAGNTRFVIERQIGYPVTPIRTRNLTEEDLDHFDVLVLPSGNYGAVLGAGGAGALEKWVKRGGVLVAMDSAVRFLADPEMKLSALRREDAFRKEPAKDDKDKKEPSTTPGALIKDAAALAALELPKKESPDASAGALVLADTDPDQWLAAGVARQLNVMASGGDIYAPLRRDDGATVVRFAAAEKLVSSGYLWQDTRDQLAFKPFVTAEPHGRGFIIAFTQDPTLRGYMDGLNVLLANALFRAPAHAHPPR
jgi:hypothetical protein